MIAVDTNILVYAHRSEITWHEAAFAALKSLAEGRARWTVPWPCVHEFIAVVTNQRLHALPTPSGIAFDQVAQWLSAGNMSLLGEGPDHLDILRTISLQGNLAGAKIHDARIAAICLEHGVGELWTADRDFSRFPRLKTRNPLVG